MSQCIGDWQNYPIPTFSHYPIIATARVQPALPPLIFAGKQAKIEHNALPEKPVERASKTVDGGRLTADGALVILNEVKNDKRRVQITFPTYFCALLFERDA